VLLVVLSAPVLWIEGACKTPREQPAQRRAALVNSLSKEFGSSLHMHGSEAGMHLTVTLPRGFRDHEVAARAARQNLWLAPLSPAYLGKARRHGFILGFGSTRATEMSQAVSRFRDALASK